jgi:hypothetical protein
LDYLFVLLKRWKMDGTVSKKQTSSVIFYNRFAAKQVESGDTIVVPQTFEKIAWIREIKDITSTSQIALIAGMILAAGL